LIYLLAQVVALSIACSAAVFVGVPSAGFLGGTAIGAAPEFAFGSVERFICPDGTLEFTSIRRSYHRPGEFEPHLACVGADGDRVDVLFRGILSVLGVAFLVAFVPVLLFVGTPLALLAHFVTRALLSRLTTST
jgi:hypothetical protein